MERVSENIVGKHFYLEVLVSLQNLVIRVVEYLGFNDNDDGGKTMVPGHRRGEGGRQWSWHACLYKVPCLQDTNKISTCAQHHSCKNY